MPLSYKFVVAVPAVSSERLPAASQQSCAEMKAAKCQKLAELRAVLVTNGYDTAAKQAAVLQLSRSTAWKILKGDHKQSGLTAAIINRMLASPDLPPGARKVIDEYVLEKLQGLYGHQKEPLKRFRLKAQLPKLYEAK